MGEVADDMIDGLCCEQCGIYFLRPHGHPVLCKDCYKDSIRDGRGKPETPKARHPER